MSKRTLTPGCIVAMRSIIDGADVYSRPIARMLRIVEKLFPEYILIFPPPECSHHGARPFFGARLTAAGVAAITPRKVIRHNAHHHAAEARL